MSSRLAFRRLLSTSSRVQSTPAAPSPAASSSAASTAAGRSAESLGFARKERTRVLPDLKINVSPSAQTAINFHMSHQSERQPRRNGDRPNRAPGSQSAPRPAGRNPSSRPPRRSDGARASNPASQSQSQSRSPSRRSEVSQSANLTASTDSAPPVAPEADFFDNADLADLGGAPTRSRASMAGLSISTDDLTSPRPGSRRAAGLPDAAAPRRTPRGPRDSARSGEARAGGRRERLAGTRASAVEVVHKAARPPVAPVVPSNARALFGQKSILTPIVRGAREAESSFWASGKDPSAARKSDVLRMAGSYSTFLPAPSAPAKSAAEKARLDALWSLAMNRSVGMRRASSAADTVKGYLG